MAGQSPICTSFIAVVFEPLLAIEEVHPNQLAEGSRAENCEARLENMEIGAQFAKYILGRTNSLAVNGLNHSIGEKLCLVRMIQKSTLKQNS